MYPKEKPIFLLAGPTGVGKSEIACHMSKHIGAEIISADSRQFYKELEIGTGKVSASLRKTIPHHMIDFLSLKETFNISRFCEKVFSIVKDIQERNNIPIIVGGSGLYLRSLIKGIFDIPFEASRKQKEIRALLEKESIAELYTKLEEIDPLILKKIHPNDRRRLSRALEVYYMTGKLMSKLQKEKTFKTIYEFGDVFYYILTRPREIIYDRIENRVDKMFVNGWVDEVEKLKQNRYEEELKSKAPIGYREILDHLEAKTDLQETVSLIKKNTRHYAKKQLGWFAREDAVWIDISDKTPEQMALHILQLSKGLLNND